MDQSFQCKWAKAVSIITPIIVLLFLAVSIRLITLLIQYPAMNSAFQVLLYAVIALMVGILILCPLFAPLGYVLGDGCIRIRRRIGDRVLALAGLEEVRLLSEEEMSGVMNFGGAGGVFGFFGYFRHPQFGVFLSYCTNFSRCVLLRLPNGKNILVSPENAEEFCRLIQEEKRLSA